MTPDRRLRTLMTAAAAILMLAYLLAGLNLIVVSTS